MRICETLGEEQGFTRIHETLGEDLQEGGFVRLWERIHKDL